MRGRKYHPKGWLRCDPAACGGLSDGYDKFTRALPFSDGMAAVEVTWKVIVVRQAN